MIKKESGMTLVEVLVTLVLVTLVGALIWTTVSISMKYNIAETKKLRLQQEANYIITEIQKFHRYCDSYILTIEPQKVALGQCQSSKAIANISISGGYFYKSEPVFVEGKKIFSRPIKAKTMDDETKDIEDSINLRLIIEDVQNDRSKKNPLKVEIQTEISRYKEEWSR